MLQHVRPRAVNISRGMIEIRRRSSSLRGGATYLGRAAVMGQGSSSGEGWQQQANLMQEGMVISNHDENVPSKLPAGHNSRI